MAPSEPFKAAAAPISSVRSCAAAPVTGNPENPGAANLGS